MLLEWEIKRIGSAPFMTCTGQQQVCTTHIVGKHFT